ncbi:DNA (cytosine-5-)-methyltransferase [Synechocystis salina LEGE 06099]|nr:DNA (cytosine-5-)-methyltransferase [Synechocystis salina LEGE 06099]
MDFRLGELFCGPGGIALGAINAKVEAGSRVYRISHAWANDYDEDTCKTYIKNICSQSSGSVICQDIREFEKFIGIESLSQIDAFAYGFPCNDFSIVGEQKGFDGKFGPLYSYGVKVLNVFKPKFFVAENVGGITSANEGKALEKILADLISAGNGYTLTAHLYRFEQYGIPQIRKRLIIVGVDKTLGLKFKVPAPTTLDRYMTAKECIESPPILQGAYNHELTSQSKNVVERLKYIKPGENAWTANLPEHLKLKVKGAKLSQIYKRLHPDKPSYTITGSGGGGTHGYHWEENRALTNRERARIQTFPDSFVFIGGKESVRKQIGMAVSPKMSEIIFEHILKMFAGIKYDYVESNFPVLKSQSYQQLQIPIAYIV